MATVVAVGMALAYLVVVVVVGMEHLKKTEMKQKRREDVIPNRTK